MGTNSKISSRAGAGRIVKLLFTSFLMVLMALFTQGCRPPPSTPTYEEVVALLDCDECSAAERELKEKGPAMVPVLAEIYAKEPVDHDALRKGAIYLLAEIHSPSAIPTLVTALQDPDPSTRVYAAEGLGRCESPDAIAPLISALENDDWGPSAHKLVEALQALGDSSALDALNHTAETSAFAHVREAAAQAVAGME